MTASRGVCSMLSQKHWNDFPFQVMGKHDVFSPRRVRHLTVIGPFMKVNNKPLCAWLLFSELPFHFWPTIHKLEKCAYQEETPSHRLTTNCTQKYYPKVPR